MGGGESCIHITFFVGWKLICGSASSGGVKSSSVLGGSGEAGRTTTVLVTEFVTERRTSTITLPRSVGASGKPSSTVGI